MSRLLTTLRSALTWAPRTLARQVCAIEAGPKTYWVGNPEAARAMAQPVYATIPAWLKLQTPETVVNVLQATIRELARREIDPAPHFWAAR